MHAASICTTMPSLLFTYSYNHLYLGSTATRLPPAYQLLSRVAHFWVPFRAKCLEEQTLTGYKTCRKQESVVVNRTGKVEVHITDNQPWNSFLEWFQMMKLLTVQFTASKAWYSLTVHYIHMATLAKTWCPCSPHALFNSFVFCTDLRLEFGRRTVGLSMAP